MVGFGLLAACGGDGGASLDDVAARLRTLDAATVVLRLSSGGEGFTVEGAFSVDGEHAYPVASLTYTPAGEGEPTRVVLTGDDGFVVVEDQAYRLPPDQLDLLRVPAEGATSAVSAVRVDEWLLDGDDRSGPGDPDVVLEDVVALATGLGASEVLVDDVEGELLVEIEADDDADLTRIAATADDFLFELELADHGDPVEVEPLDLVLPYEQLGR